MEILQPGLGPIRSATYLPADPSAVLWGHLPCATDSAVLTIDSGTEVTIDTFSHEGILEDQGRDPRAFFGGFGATDFLDDAVALAASDRSRGDGLRLEMARFRFRTPRTWQANHSGRRNPFCR